MNPVGFGCYYVSLGLKAKTNLVGLTYFIAHFSAVGTEFFPERGH